MRILTYNTRGSLGMDGRRDTARIASVVRGVSPDAVCFQEIHQRLAWSGGEDQPRVLEELLGRAFRFQRNMTYGFGGYGVGIATRADITAALEHPLPSYKEQRGVLELRLRNVGDLKSVTLFCTHWGLNSDERLEQAEALSALVLQAPRPVIVCGDFNEERNGRAVDLLIGSSGLCDAGEHENRTTFVSQNPTQRIDYILHTPDLEAYRVEIVNSLASDHLPLLADIRSTSTDLV